MPFQAPPGGRDEERTEVQARPAAVAEPQQQSAAMMQSALRGALGGVDNANAALGQIRRVVQSVNQLRHSEGKRITPAGARVTLKDEGRSGTVTYGGPDTCFEPWWEMGTAAPALVDVPTEEKWTRRTDLPESRRREVLGFIGEEILTRQTSGGSFIIGVNVITIHAD